MCEKQSRTSIPWYNCTMIYSIKELKFLSMAKLKGSPFASTKRIFFVDARLYIIETKRLGKYVGTLKKVFE